MLSFLNFIFLCETSCNAIKHRVEKLQPLGSATLGIARNAVKHRVEKLQQLGSATSGKTQKLSRGALIIGILKSCLQL